MQALSVCCLLLFVSLARAQLLPYWTAAENLFSQEDLDKDGDYTLAETQAHFNSFDSNFDGTVTREEFTPHIVHLNAALFPLASHLFEMYDMDKNGVITLFDFQSLFYLIDCNENNIVGRPEYLHYWSITLKAMNSLHHPEGGVFVPPTPPPAPGK